jgi:hypothetical protein
VHFFIMSRWNAGSVAGGAQIHPGSYAWAEHAKAAGMSERVGQIRTPFDFL